MEMNSALALILGLVLSIATLWPADNSNLATDQHFSFVFNVSWDELLHKCSCLLYLLSRIHLALRYSW